ncbi:hypothetical protein [Vibrio sp. HN007]|uniref:hypothetical protein n=1 Tax=Vibrio iocasae TaxID=3098914 RepID=UPI0035D3DFA2
MPQLSAYFNHEVKRKFEKGGYISAQTNIETLHADLVDSHHLKQVDIFQSKRLKDNDKGDGFIFINTLDITFTYDTPISMEEITNLMVKVTNLFTFSARLGGEEFVLCTRCDALSKSVAIANELLNRTRSI